MAVQSHLHLLSPSGRSRLLVVILLQLLALFACELLRGPGYSQMQKYINIKQKYAMGLCNSSLSRAGSTGQGQSCKTLAKPHLWTISCIPVLGLFHMEQ